MSKLDVLLKQERLIGRVLQLQIEIQRDRKKLVRLEKRFNKKYG